MAVFWDAMLCRLVETCHFGGAYCLHQDDDGGSKHLRNTSKLYETVGHNMSEDSHLHTHNHENLKPHSENQVEKMGDKCNWLRIASSGSLRY
jgi:hypothetical protein